LGEAGRRVRDGLASGLLDLVDSEGVIRSGDAARRLGLPRNLLIEIAHDLKSRGLIHLETHLFREAELIRLPRSEREAPAGGFRARVIAVSNQKGGVGKTATSVNLSAALALLGRKTLLLDLDSQANATSGLGFNKHEIKRSIYDAMVNYTPLSEIILHTSTTNLDLIPSNVHLAGVNIELVNLPSRETRLRRVLSEVKGSYEFIIIDCPPSLGLLTVNGLVAADSVLVPIQCDYYALEGISQLLGTLDLVRERLNPSLRIEGILLTMFDARTNLSTQISENVRSYFKEKVYNTVIPRNVKLSEAASFGKSILDYDRYSSGARSYLSLAKEVTAGG
jgi:chromosome partitioning protein